MGFGQVCQGINPYEMWLGLAMQKFSFGSVGIAIHQFKFTVQKF